MAEGAPLSLRGHIFNQIDFKQTKISSNLVQTVIHIPPKVVAYLNEKVINSYKHHIKPAGLESYSVSQDFILEKYGDTINKTIERFILRHFVIDYLKLELKKRKILVVHQPRLMNIEVKDDASISYTFRFSTLDTLMVGEWKKFPFKSPKRKLYKDLDKQVEAFYEREGTLFNDQDQTAIEEGDWIELEINFLDDKQQPLLKGTAHRYWFKFSIKYLTDAFKQIFVGKKVGDAIMARNFPFSDGLNDPLSDRSLYKIKILSTSKGNHFSVDMFKMMFNLKNKLEIHKKLIEVFSFRNDISQRKSIVEEVFNLLLSKQRFEVPQHLTLRKQEDLLKSLKRLPDYQVYKTHKNFDKHLETLAEKQLKEEAIIDSIAYKETIVATQADIQSYLHLFNHDRLREFVYFKPSIEHFDELDSPIPEGILQEAVTREKTLNLIIHQLTR